MSIWYCDRLLLAGIVDISLIRDEANVETPHRGPVIEVPPLSVNLDDTVYLAQVVDPAAPEYADPTLVSSSVEANSAPSLSSSKLPSSSLVLLALVQKL